MNETIALPECLLARVPSCGEVTTAAWTALARTLLPACGDPGNMENDPVRAIHFAHVVSLLLMSEKIEARLFTAFEENAASLPSATLLRQASLFRREALACLENLRKEGARKPCADADAASTPPRDPERAEAAKSVPRLVAGAPAPLPLKTSPGLPGCSVALGTPCEPAPGQEPTGITAPGTASREPSSIAGDGAEAISVSSPGARLETGTSTPARSVSAGLTRERFMDEVRSSLVTDPQPSGEDKEKRPTPIRRWVSVSPPSFRVPVPIRPIRPVNPPRGCSQPST
ncbi:MAG TPA: hypothetical protein PK379_08005 [Candidatus Hydrogenedentes bacterium]|nr:hypothetical protein [Candidatus Hydrogenedentota bacterium]